MEQLDDLAARVNDDVARATRDRKAGESGTARTDVRADAHGNESERGSDSERGAQIGIGLRTRGARLHGRKNGHRRQPGNERHGGTPVEDHRDGRIRQSNGRGTEQDLR
jgi:hypothetical protein